MTDLKPVVIDDPIARKFRLDPGPLDQQLERLAVLWAGMRRAPATIQVPVPPHVDTLAEMVARLGGPEVSVGFDMGSLAGERTAMALVPLRNGRGYLDGAMARWPVFPVRHDSRIHRARTVPPRAPAPLKCHLDPAALRPSSSAPIVCTDRLLPTAGQGWVRTSSTPRRPRR